MPKVKRTRSIDAPVREVWDLVSDPHHLPRWWPAVERVEEADALRWTKVFGTGAGKTVRADYTRVLAEEPSRLVWRQELAASPFERIMSSSEVEIALEPEDAATRVRLTATQRLRGLSRFGSFMIRRATRRQLDQALAALEEVLAR